VNRTAAALLCGIGIGCTSAAVVRLPVDVIDGDTIRLADEVVRLEGIDAPES
jgi:endonuclease YncB( thermonuclease family)